MSLTVWVSGGGHLFVLVSCLACGERVCQYTKTDLDELCAEYGAHLRARH